MTQEITIVLPFSGELFAKVKNANLAVLAEAPGNINAIEAAVRAQNRLAAVLLSSSKLELPAGLQPKSAPLSSYLDTAGRFLDYAGRVGEFSRSPVRFYFPATAENAVSARILSSLGVKAGLDLRGDKVDWDAACDLLHYDAYGKMPHEPIEPFASAYLNYGSYTYAEAYLERAGKYVHCDEAGNISNSRQDLRDRVYIGTLDKLSEVDIPAQAAADRQRALSVFMKLEGCAVCPAYKVCARKKTGQAVESCECREFMTALQEASREVNLRKGER